ncbi:MAG: bifunctional alpha,alpha-trehalose-phosphate synthase (UDP-forming)/trehalose-phosphatase [Candidatus Glassbacteria bacterium]|nr:bifunctional alpha,alpha-trehalose-phosphate synthase (UDP-forming)/trehalose-phosphatase [Candidatus Glassbacteria bacterium]
MDNLMLVSNRLPVSIERRKGELQFRPSVGGLATGLASFYKSYESRWIGWSGIPLDSITEAEREHIAKVLKRDYNSHPIFFTQKEVKNFYNGFCNKTIWPMLLYFTEHVVYDKIFWESYKHVNRLFCNAVIKNAREDEVIWIHDYHLMLLPGMIREKRPDSRIGFFLHTSFPSFEIFRLLPWRSEILKGVLGADLIGFHTYDYVRHFLSSVQRLLGHDCTLGKINTGERIIKVDTFPIGIDYKRFSQSTWDVNVQKEKNKWKKKLFGKKIILSVDRVDYTKGIPRRLEAISMFLEKYPEYRKKIIYILLAVPSREQLGQYKLLKKQIDELVGNINGKYGSIEWTPVLYLHRSLPFHQLVALYNTAHVAMVTSFRDGMNLVAKEYLASKPDGRGVLILSETVGAAKELGEAVIVNPNNIEEMVEALKTALTMPEKEQVKRNRVMQRRLEHYNIVRWAEEFIKRLHASKEYQRRMQAKVMTREIRKELVGKYRKSTRRLFLLDYDGTLVPFFGKPEEAVPSRDLLKMLARLAGDPQNELVLISGRDKDTMQKWFGELNIAMSAEHGAWIKNSSGEWEIISTLDTHWKNEVRPVLELFEDRTPGSQLEEKQFSLAWHYRRVDSELGLQRVIELVDDLSDFSEAYNLQVKHGDKTVELKNGDINKGRAAMHWVARNRWDLIVAIGDQWTDEDLFDVLPEEACSIKVGLSPSQAKYSLESPKEVRQLLKELVAEQ